MNLHQKLLIDYWEKLGSDLESVTNQLILNSAISTVDLCLYKYLLIPNLDPGELAFLYSTGND